MRCVETFYDYFNTYNKEYTMVVMAFSMRFTCVAASITYDYDEPQILLFADFKLHDAAPNHWGHNWICVGHSSDGSVKMQMCDIAKLLVQRIGLAMREAKRERTSTIIEAWSKKAESTVQSSEEWTWEDAGADRNLKFLVECAALMQRGCLSRQIIDEAKEPATQRLMHSAAPYSVLPPPPQQKNKARLKKQTPILIRQLPQKKTGGVPKRTQWEKLSMRIIDTLWNEHTGASRDAAMIIII